MASLIPRMAPLLNKFIPPALALKGLSKIDSKLGNFITNAVSVGYATDSILDYLRKKTSQDYHNEAGRSLRPDEINAAKNYDPSQNKKTLATAVGLGAAGLGLMGGNQQGGNDESQAIQPDEISRGIPRQAPKQIGGSKQPLQLTEQKQPGIPPQGSTIVPPLQPGQQQQANKASAMQKFQQHQQKKSMLQQEAQRFEQGYGQALQQLNEEEQQLMQQIQADRQGQVGQQNPQQDQGNSASERIIAAINELKRVRGR